jgi:multiple antibiotic resistance protein
MDIFRQIIHDYVVLFAMVNAVGNLPVFADLTHGMESPVRNRTFRIAVITAGSIVMGFAFFGDWMLKSVFEVDTAALKIAGGILVFIVAARGVLQGPRLVGRTKRSSEDIAVFPLGFPFLAGPGTILTTILLFQDGGSVVTAAATVLVYASVIPILHLAPLIERALGRVGVLVVTRILYIFIGAKAVTFVIQGIRASLHIL